MRELRRRRRPETGMSLTELLVVISLLAVVMVTFFNVLVSVQRSLVKQTDRSLSNDQARLAVEELDREIRSSNVLYDPQWGDACQPDGTPVGCAATDHANGIDPGMSLRIYTQANAPSREVGGTPGERCVQWRIKGGQLQRRDWPKDSPSAVSAWRIVADHLVNQPGTSSAFTVDPAKRIVNVTLLVNQNAAHGNTVRLDTSVEGRNTVYGYPPSVCSSLPSSY